MKIWAIAVGAILVGVVAALGSIYLEFAGVSTQFEAHNQPQVKASSAGSQQGDTPSPKATVIDGPDYDFGGGQRDSKMSHQFVIENEGRGPLTLEKGPTSCKCTLSELTQGKILPGESAVVKLDWTLKSGSTKFKQTAEIHTNDPEAPTIFLSVSGKVWDLVRLDPTELVLTNLSSSGGGNATFRLYSYRDKEFQVVRHELANPETAKYYDVSFTSLMAEELKAEPDAVAGLLGTVRAKSGLPLGPINQTIRLTTNVEGAKEFELAISGSVVSDISLVGPRDFDDEHNLLRLGTVHRAEGSQTNLHVLIKGPHRRDVRLTVKETDPKDVLTATLGEPKEINGGAAYMYPLTIDVPKGARPVEHLGSAKGKYGKIVIETTHPTTTIINVYVRFAVE